MTHNPGLAAHAKVPQGVMEGYTIFLEVACITQVAGDEVALGYFR